ncbi:hypothetical protein D3C71_1374870 [compost metagenome]
MHIAQHVHIGLAQLCRQRREQRNFRTIGRLQARALGRLVQAVGIGAGIDMATGQREGIGLQACAVLGGDHLHAIARGRHAQITDVGHAYRRAAAGHR